MERDTRQLAAIMLTDVVGYTALTQADEALTLALLDEHSALVRPLFAEHGGREVKCTGDGFLVEFPSALQAVRCAVEIQRALHDRNDAVPLDRSIHVRIGVHLGDVVHRDGDIFGDGVNITARIQPLAQPGGICLSRQVYDQVWNKVDLRMATLGKRELKNVKAQIEIYQIVLPWLQGDAPALRATDGTRLAVLPLVSMSPDPSDEYFADGLTEELIFTLAKVSGLDVIALTSVMKYRGAKKAVSEIGDELGVSSILEGSVRKAGNRLRITLQLIDVARETHLWAEAYDRTLDDVFAVQGEVARSVAAALAIQLMPRPAGRAAEATRVSSKAYATYLKGRALLSTRALVPFQEGIALLEQAVALDPSWGKAHAALAIAWAILPNYLPHCAGDVLPKAKAAALHALSLDGESPEAHVALALVLESEWDWDGCICELERAIAIMPSYAQAYHAMGLILLTHLRFDEAIAALETSIALDPLSAIQHGALAQARWWAGDLDAALAEFGHVLLLGADSHILRAMRALIYLEQGRLDLARADIERARELAGPNDLEIELSYARIMAALGERGAVEQALARALALGEREPVSPYFIALHYFALGRADEGFSMLERAFEERDYQSLSMACDPQVAAYRSDPRYANLCRRMGIAAQDLSRWMASEKAR